MRFRLEARLTDSDVGRRVVIRWRRPAGDGGEQVADVLGVLEAADAVSFSVRKASGELVVVPGNAHWPARRRRRRLAAGNRPARAQPAILVRK